MRKVIVGAMTSLDGVMQAPGGPTEDPTGGFKFGGWVFPYFDETLGQAVGDLFGKPFDLLLGRKTYDIFAAYWPYVGKEDSIGPVFDRVTKYVATRNPELKLNWQNSQALGRDVIASLKKLKGADGPDLLTQGSTNFLHTLFANDLVDEISLTLFPVVLGKGKRLFADGAAPHAWTLVNSKTSPRGVMLNRYARAGDVATGSFAADHPSAAEIERRKNLK